MKTSLLQLFIVAIILTGCSQRAEHLSTYTVTGGVAGAGVGAVSGVIIGSVISNGDVGASTLLGTAIGAGSGLAIGVLSYALSEQNTIDLNAQEIAFRQQHIANNQRFLNDYRARVDQDSAELNPDPALKEYIYVGQSLGNPYR